MRTITWADEKWFIEHCNFDPKQDNPNEFCKGTQDSSAC